jgi:Ca-activated chloride channel homolog
MRCRWALLCLAGVLAGVGLEAQERPVRGASRFRSGVEVIRITATVSDAEGNLVSGLPREAFEVYEDGARQKITQFTNERVPVSLAVLLDASDSMYGRRIQDAREAVERFLFESLDPSDEFLLLAFNHRPNVLTEWTRSREVLQPALSNLQPFGGTAIYDAVMTSLPLIAGRAEQRAAILLISDGADSASDASLLQLRTAMLRSDVFAYAIAVNSPDPRPINTQVNPVALREITDGSGGRTEVVRDTTDLQAATARIAEELNNQYLLGYDSPHGPDGQYHSIRVRVQGGAYRVRARNGYVAGTGPQKRP